MSKKYYKGVRFNHLTLIEKTSIKGAKNVKWLLKCDCGNKVDKHISNVSSGKVKACGRCYLTGKHGDSKSKLYGVWLQMKSRCYNPNHKSYCNYGAKGIDVTKEWVDDFFKFKKWALENGYEEGLEIDRKKYKTGYKPSNCRFVTQQINLSENKSTLHINKLNGKKYNARQFSELLNISYDSVLKHNRNGIYSEELIDKVKSEMAKKESKRKLRDSKKKAKYINSSRSLSLAQVKEIRDKWIAGGMIQKDAAKAYGVSVSVISSIVRNKTYKDELYIDPFDKGYWFVKTG